MRSLRFPVALRFTIEGDLRYLSHRDELRFLCRTMVRARWPVAFTYGFNPIPRITIPLPRPVGLATEDQLALIDLLVEESAENLRNRLEPVLPPECRLLQLVMPCTRETPHARVATFRVPLRSADMDVVVDRIRGALLSETLLVDRPAGEKKPAKRIDVRPLLDDLFVERGNELMIRLRFLPSGSIKPNDVLRVLGLAADWYDHRITRVAIEWDADLAAPEGAAIEKFDERTNLGYEEEITEREEGRSPAAFNGAIEDR